MICVDTKFFAHMVDCLEKQKIIHLQPYKDKILWQDKIDKTVIQCKMLLDDAIKDERKVITKKALSLIPDKSLFDDKITSLEEVEEE
ncbi:MAG: hypothetical protein KKC77_19650 [Proteobacteria bacterium]|nr:hypothetical protein [Pseudomonadota bacterium]